MKQIFEHALFHAKGFRIFILISIVLLIIADIFGIYIPYLFGTLINKIQSGEEGQVRTAVLAVMAMTASHLVIWLREHIDLKKYFFSFGEKIEGYASRRLMMLSLGQHMKMNSGVVHETIGGGVNALKDFVISVLFSLLPHIFYVTLSLGAIMFVSWEMGVVVTSLSAVYLFVAIRFNRSYEERLLSLETESRKRSKFKSEMLRNVVPVKLGGQEDWFTEKYNQEIGRVNQLARSIWLRYNFGSNLIGLIRIVITAATLLFGIFLIKTGQETAGTFVMFFSWVSGVTARLGSIRSELRQLSRQIPSIKKYLEMVGQEPDLDESGTIEKIPYGKITFDNVTYRYPSGKDGDERGISNVSFEISPGEMIGIVGESGAGKSTLIKLVARAWDPISGGIYIDNTSLTEFSPVFRRQIVYVEQEGQLFDESIRFNLTFGMENEVSDDALWKTLKDTQLAERIIQSKDGLDALVGERGIRLSGGERQRLLMARAMIRKAKILILDEATSNMDVNTEEGIFQNAIRKASLETTTIIVAHRFATLKSCSRVMVMDDGRIVAFDTHSELMRTCGIYRKLVEKQTLALTN